MKLATVAQRTLLLHLPLRSLIHCMHERTPGQLDRISPPAGERPPLPCVFSTTYSDHEFHTFAQPWVHLTTLHLDSAPLLAWVDVDDDRHSLLPAADWRFEVLIFEISCDWNPWDFFFHPSLHRRVKVEEYGWPCVRRIEVRASREVEDNFRSHLAEYKVDRDLTRLQLRLFSLVVFLESDGRGPERRLVKQGSFP